MLYSNLIDFMLSNNEIHCPPEQRDDCLDMLCAAGFRLGFDPSHYSGNRNLTEIYYDDTCEEIHMHMARDASYDGPVQTISFDDILERFADDGPELSEADLEPLSLLYA